MSHLRIQIRQHVTTLLRNNIQKANVFSSRLRALNNENLPAILIYTQRRVQWEAAVRAARSGNVQITTTGWTQSNGEPWKINTFVPVKSESLSLNTDCLITGVTFLKDDQQGSLTQLALMRPDAFESKPTLPAKSDPWFGDASS